MFYRKTIQKIVFITLTYTLTPIFLWSCSCNPFYFCDVLQTPDHAVAFKARVIDQFFYNESKLVTSMEVLRVFRDDEGLTDTIKLFGSTWEGQCKVDVHNRFKQGETYYVGIRTRYNGEPMTYYYYNPHATETIWDFAPVLCGLVILRENELNVWGRITEEIREYPRELFESRIDNCQFDLEELNLYRCNDDSYIVYPNPSHGSEIWIKNNYLSTAFEKLRIYDLNGRLLQQHFFEPAKWQYIPVSISNKGHFVLQYHCNNRDYYKLIWVK